MAHGHPFFGIAFGIFHILVAGGFLYFMYSISKSLKKIADKEAKKD